MLFAEKFVHTSVDYMSQVWKRSCTYVCGCLLAGQFDSLHVIYLGFFVSLCLQDVALFKEGLAANDAIKLMAENGDNSALLVSLFLDLCLGGYY